MLTQNLKTEMIYCTVRHWMKKKHCEQYDRDDRGSGGLSHKVLSYCRHCKHPQTASTNMQVTWFCTSLSLGRREPWHHSMSNLKHVIIIWAAVSPPIKSVGGVVQSWNISIGMYTYIALKQSDHFITFLCTIGHTGPIVPSPIVKSTFKQQSDQLNHKV